MHTCSPTHYPATAPRFCYFYESGHASNLQPRELFGNNCTYCFTICIDGQHFKPNRKFQKLIYHLFALPKQFSFEVIVSVISARFHILQSAKPDYSTRYAPSFAIRQCHVIFLQLRIRDKLEGPMTYSTLKKGMCNPVALT